MHHTAVANSFYKENKGKNLLSGNPNSSNICSRNYEHHKRRTRKIKEVWKTYTEKNKGRSKTEEGKFPRLVNYEIRDIIRENKIHNK